MQAPNREAIHSRLGPLYDLTIVLPTFNEVGNIAPLLAKLDAALSGVRWEAVFVDDDSTDGTPLVIVAAAGEYHNVRIIRRIGRRGLSSAVVEGAMSSMARYIAVMDADMQHDETILKPMLNELRTQDCDLVIATRYDGGSVGDWSHRRILISRAATRIAQALTGVNVSDPMSGYFVITRDAFENVVRNLSGQGFKLLLDITASAKPPLKVKELPYEFRMRQFGESKLDSLVAIEFMMLLLDKTFGRFIPARFFLFATVGLFGLLIHIAVLATIINLIRLPFVIGQSIATTIAMTANFFVNNYLTYWDRRLKGAKDITRGLVSFFAVCSLGAFANVGIANTLFTSEYSWWLSGVAGVFVGAVWNYAATSVFTWRNTK